MADLSLIRQEAMGTVTSTGGGLCGLFGDPSILRRQARGPQLFNSTLATFRVIDEQDHCNKGKWSYLPQGLTQQMIERMIYYRPSLCFFYFNGSFYMLPYTGKGPLDVYGRYTKITPIKFAGGGNKEEPLDYLELTPIYDCVDINEWTPKMMETSCVILNDYTPQLSQTYISRAQLNEPLLQSMAICVPYCRTALKNSVGLTLIKVPEEADGSSIQRLNDATQEAAICGDALIGYNGSLSAEVLNGQAPANAEQFLLSLQAWDNLRLSTHGLKNGGLFQKRSQVLDSEEEVNQGQTNYIFQDNLYNRQLFCDIVNSIWPLGIDYEPSEVTVGVDTDMNGVVEDTVNEESNPYKAVGGGDVNE